MNNNQYVVLPLRWMYKLADRVVEYGAQPVQQGIIIGIIQDLDPALYRIVLRSIIKAVYSSEDTKAKAAGCLSKALVRGVDYVHSEVRENMKGFSNDRSN